MKPEDHNPQTETAAPEAQSGQNSWKSLEELWNKLEHQPTELGDAWDRAVEKAKKEDPREFLDGQRFQGQGE